MPEYDSLFAPLLSLMSIGTHPMLLSLGLPFVKKKTKHAKDIIIILERGEFGLFQTYFGLNMFAHNRRMKFSMKTQQKICFIMND